MVDSDDALQIMLLGNGASGLRHHEWTLKKPSRENFTGCLVFFFVGWNLAATKTLYPTIT